MQADVQVPLDVNFGKSADSVIGKEVHGVESGRDDVNIQGMNYGIKLGEGKDIRYNVTDDCISDHTVPCGYLLGVPHIEATSLQASLHGNEDLDIDPHYAFFGCNTESEVQCL